VKIGVLMKQVPDTETKIRIKDDASGIVTEGIKWVMNPYDEYAVEEALRIKEKKGGTVSIICLGPKRSVEAIRTGLAMGADNGFLIDDPALEGSDSYVTARALAKVLEPEKFDLILCGKQAVDDDSAQVAQAVAEFLGVPQAIVIEKLEISEDGKKAICYRRIEGGAKEVLEVDLPAVIAAEKGLNEPRYASLPGIMKAKSKPMKEVNLSGLEMKAEEVGAAGSRVKIQKFSLPPDKEPGKVIPGEPDEAARELTRLLREEAKVI
jgi:electron transfer flavoprotein beta subunit